MQSLDIAEQRLDMSDRHHFIEAITAALYRLAAYATHNLIDDAAMLAFIFS